MSFSCTPETLLSPKQRMNDVEALLDMLRYMRPASSKSERKFIARFLKPLGVTQDAFGNLHTRIGTAPIMWSSHTDTAHGQGGKQGVVLDTKTGMITAVGVASNCLGADCTAGVWLMREMILAGIEGLYVFHRQEEIGGRGSSWIVKNTPELVEGIKACIAFDRRGKASVVTHQFSSRSCSDDFAYSVASLLGGGYAPDPNGIFTDSANYTDLIGECSNVSVGYYDEHRAHESLDVNHLLTLRDTLISMPLNQFDFSRNPGDEDDYWADTPRTPRSTYSSWANYLDDDNAEDIYQWKHGYSKYERMRTIIHDHPDIIVDILDSLGVGPDDILEQVYEMGCGR